MSSAAKDNEKPNLSNLKDLLNPNLISTSLDSRRICGEIIKIS